MKRLLSTAALTLLTFIAVSAQSMFNIHQKDGSVVSYNFSQQPVITYSASTLHVTIAGVSIDYPLADLEKIDFKDREIEDGIMSIKGTATDVKIFSIDGTLLQTVKATEGAASFSTSVLPSGTYIIQNGQTSYKVTKR